MDVAKQVHHYHVVNRKSNMLQSLLSFKSVLGQVVILGVLSAVACACVCLGEPESTSLYKKRVDPYLQANVALLASRIKSSLKTPGVYLAVAKNGIIVAAAAAGVRSLQSRSELTENDVVMLGSVSKPMAGFVVGQLTGQGKLSYNDTIGQLCPELVRGSTTGIAKATLGNLLTHTSGLPVKLYQHEYIPRASDTPKSYLRAYCLDYATTPLLFQPGSEFRYAGGLAFVSEMAEAVAGEDFLSLEAKHLKAGLGLSTLSFGEQEGDHVVRGHMIDSQSGALQSLSDDWRKNDVRWKAHPGGNLSMSLLDATRFVAMASVDFRGIPNVSAPHGGWQKFYQPTSKASSYTHSGWGTYWRGLWHEGNSGRGELVKAEVDRVNRIALLLYVNCNYPDNSFSFGSYTDQLFALAKS